MLPHWCIPNALIDWPYLMQLSKAVLDPLKSSFRSKQNINKDVAMHFTPEQLPSMSNNAY